jgi:hypothetical protein
MTGSPELKREHLPEAITPFVFDTAARMGVDPAAVALAAIVSLERFPISLTRSSDG